MPNIRFEKIEKSFGSVRVLSPIDLVLDAGEFTVLVGPSGCGKSTTLRILAGLESPNAGEIYFDGKPISHLAPKDRDIAMVFQDYALYPHMNIAKNMSFALRLRRAPKAEIEEKVRRVAGTLNIAHLLDRKPAELSGGHGSASPWAGPWSGTRRRSCSTSRSRTWMRTCGPGCAPSWPRCATASTRT